ncbi:aminopeptidase N-like [Athalia rosae]|uniref:aminopeptidase N-like n=1 Tax=Athalia rosae TaxID=37344 RepID=UPI0020341345|nr:aminopeptidase N-like [Athalia rosae]
MIESRLLLVLCIISGLALSGQSPLTSPDELLAEESFEETDTATKSTGELRLPKVTRPTDYKVKLNPDLENGKFTFTGEVEITLKVLEPTNDVTIHSKEQIIAENRTTLTNEENFSYDVEHSYDIDKDFLSIHTNETLPIGTYVLTIHYTGNLRDDMIGFYKSSYIDLEGNTVWIATSKFEPTHARYAFPCYDEPALKARVSIWLKHSSSQHALANTPIMDEFVDSSDGKIWTVFETTPPISTYLVAFIASDFANISNSDETFGVWARPSAIDTARYSFDFGSQALAALAVFTNVPYYNYAMDKMDQIAIPDFAAGAMENWGLVTYRERYLLYEDGVSTTSDKQNIATVVAHEFSHQWFGNLVSPEWWTYLWLNEGFATYFEYFLTAEIEPSWRLDEQFVVSEIHASAFPADGLGTSHPMNADVETPAQISDIFDSISYAKAGAVIRMLEHIVTTPVFRAGLTNYLNANNFSVGTSDLLWASMQTAVDDAGQSLNVKQHMDTWVTRAGFPLVTASRNYESGAVTLSQERFFLRNRDSYYPKVSWWIPINWATASAPDYSVTTPTTWISDSATTTVSVPSAGDWILLNLQQTGYYRVNYDKTNWNLLTAHLTGPNYTQISAVNRAQLIDDALNLARAGYLDYGTALGVTKYLSQEIDYIPWYSAFSAFTYLNRWLPETASYADFKTYVTGLLAGALDKVGYEESDDDKHVEKFLRTNALTWSCNLGQSECLEFANRKLLSWLIDDDQNAVTPDLKSVIYCAGIRTANSTVWKLLWEKYLATDLSSEQVLILRGLGCTPDREILNKYMELATATGSGIRPQDSTTAFSSVYTYGGAQNVEPALDYIINNFDNILAYYGSTSSIATLLSGIGLRITTNEQLTKLQNFSIAQAALLSGAANTGISNARSNLAWIETNEEAVGAWLRETIRSGTNNIIGSVLLTFGLACLLRIYQ